MLDHELLAGQECSTCSVQKEAVGLTIGELAAKDSRKAAAMQRMGIDFCCGGNKTIEQAAAEAGLTVEALNRVLIETEHSPSDIYNSFDKWDIDFLADYIYNQHHKYFYENRDIILQIFIKVLRAHGQKHPELTALARLVIKLFDELKVHFCKEEKVLFPYIKELVSCKKHDTQPSGEICIAQGPLAMMHMEHEAAGEILKNMRSLTNNYQPPRNACNSFRQLYLKLEELESDLRQHMHLENNILFPKALKLEKEFAT